MTQNLRIVTWNANGLTDRKLELEIFLATEKIDVALISESRFTSKSHLTIKNYNVYTTNHPSGNSHGGTAVIINLTYYITRSKPMLQKRYKPLRSRLTSTTQTLHFPQSIAPQSIL